MRRFLFLLMLATPAVAAEPPAVPLYKVFGRWIVACDNVRRCEARGFNDGTRADLRITRDAGPGKPAATFSWDTMPDPASLRLDGKTLQLSSPPWVTDRTEQTLSTRDANAVTTFIGAIRNGERITSTLSADDEIPLTGFVAAMLLMDAVQGRPGTPTALAAERGDNGVPGAPGLPRRAAWHKTAPLTEGEAATLVRRALADPAIQQQRKAGDCDSQDKPDAYALDTATALVLAPCQLFAYQGSTMAVIIPRRDGPPRAFEAALPGLQATQGQDAFLIDGSFDPGTGVLATAAKGRGVADCGLSASWVWSAGAFRLARLDYLDPCGGAQPGDWPTLYRTAR